MDGIAITPCSDAGHRRQLVALWKAVFGYEALHNKPTTVIDNKIVVSDQLSLFAVPGGGPVVGTIIAGYDGHRGWIYSVAVSPSHRRRGIGARLVSVVVGSLIHKGCMKINLQIQAGNEGVAAFYSLLGYCVEKRLSMGKRIRENIPDA